MWHSISGLHLFEQSGISVRTAGFYQTSKSVVNFNVSY